MTIYYGPNYWNVPYEVTLDQLTGEHTWNNRFDLVLFRADLTESQPTKEIIMSCGKSKGTKKGCGGKKGGKGC